MLTKKEQAINLRKEGKSYLEITRLIEVPKSTLSSWLQNIELSDKIRKFIEDRKRKAGSQALISRNKAQTALAHNRSVLIRNKAAKEVDKLNKKNLFLLGIALYWAEGYKQGANGSKWKCVDFTNSDPHTVKLMIKFFRQICNVPNEQFRIQVMVHSSDQVKPAITYWSNLLKLPKNQFIKTFVWNYQTKKDSHKRLLQFGTIHVRIYDVNLFYQIIGWIDGLKKRI